MKIAQIAPLHEAVPPRLYGGTERVIHYLTEELVAQGHDVTLFASGDSDTSARLVPCSKQALRLDSEVIDTTPHHLLMLSKVRSLAAEFDILHFHTDQMHFPLFEDEAGRCLTTLHGRQDVADLRLLYSGFPGMRLVAISGSQRRILGKLPVAATIFHGLPGSLLGFSRVPRGGYLAFLGRVSPEKGLGDAIAIARAAGLPLKIAAKVDAKDAEYYRSEIAPLLTSPDIEFIGEINERRKESFLGDALALLFPINWPEPFGLAMIEAMACGTPVLAFNSGSAAEVVDDGITGYLANSVEEGICKMGALLALDRGRVRRRFEERFLASRMASDYLRVYQRMNSSARMTRPAHVAGLAKQSPLAQAREAPSASGADDRL